MSRKLPDNQKKKYTPFNLPVELVQELKAWREANVICKGGNYTNEDLIRDMLRLYERNRRKYQSQVLVKARELIEKQKEKEGQGQ